MRPHSIWIANISLAVALLCPAYGAIYYINPDGSDLNSGSESAPWQTLQKGLDTAVAGDTIRVAAGNYPDAATTKRDGTSDKEITIDGRNGSAIVTGRITVTNSYHHFVNLMIRGNYINCSGSGVTHCTFDFCTFSGGTFGIRLSDPETHDGSTGPGFNHVSHCTFIGPMAGDAMVSINGHHNVIDSNLFRDAGGWDAIHPWGRNNVIKKNHFLHINSDQDATSGNHADILQVFRASNSDPSNGLIFEQNIIEDCTAQFGNATNNVPSTADMGNWTIRNNLFVNSRIQFNCSLPDVKIYNNTAFGSEYPVGFRFRNDASGAANNAQVMNNIFVDCGTNATNGFYTFAKGLTGCTADYNLITGPSGLTKIAGQEGPHGIVNGCGATQIFIDPLNRNYRLRPASPAIKSGVFISTVTVDLDSQPRSLPWDIGAYVFRPTPATFGSLRREN